MPPKTTKNALAKRKAEQQKLQQQLKRRRLIWFSTVGLLLILIIVVLTIQPKPKPVEFDYAALPVLGQADAPVKIVEFGDYQCPSCKHVNELIKPELAKDYIDQGKVAFYFMNLPFIGSDSFTAALAAQSVYHQSNDAFWKYFDAIFERQGRRTTVGLRLNFWSIWPKNWSCLSITTCCRKISPKQRTRTRCKRSWLEETSWA